MSLLWVHLHPHVMHVLWTHPTQHSKLHLDWFSRLCTAHADSPYTLQCAITCDLKNQFLRLMQFKKLIVWQPFCLTLSASWSRIYICCFICQSLTVSTWRNVPSQPCRSTILNVLTKFRQSHPRWITDVGGHEIFGTFDHYLGISQKLHKVGNELLWNGCKSRVT